MMKPIVLIYWGARVRSPTSTELYEYLEENCKDVIVKTVRDTPIGIDIRDVANTYLSGKLPDIVFDGFGASYGSVRSWPIIKENGIGLIRTIGDVESQYPEFVNPQNQNMVEFNAVCEPDVLFVPGPDKNRYTAKLKKIMKSTMSLAHAQLFNMPMPISSDLFDPKDTVKDLNYAFICTVSNPAQFGYHLNRQMIYDTLVKYPDKSRIVGPIFEREAYVHSLKRAKIFIAETSMRGALVYKYIEAALAGCLLIAEKPEGVDDLFIDGETFISLDMANIETDLPKKLDYWIKHDKERIEIAKRMQKKMREYADMEKGRKTFEEMCLSLYEQKHLVKEGPKCAVCGKEDTTPTIGGLLLEIDGKVDRVDNRCWAMALKRIVEKEKELCDTGKGSTSSETKTGP